MKLKDNSSLQEVVDVILGVLLGRVLYDLVKDGVPLRVALGLVILAAALLAWHLLKRRWMWFSAMFVGTFLGMVLANR